MATTLKSGFDGVVISTGESPVQCALPKKKTKRRSSKPNDRQKLENRLMRTACSAAWVEAQIQVNYEIGEDGQLIAAHVFIPGVYPPKADSTPMRQCRHCRRWTPGNYIGSKGVCADCHAGTRFGQRENDAYGSSPFGVVMHGLRVTRSRVREIPLLPMPR